MRGNFLMPNIKIKNYTSSLHFGAAVVETEGWPATEHSLFGGLVFSKL